MLGKRVCVTVDRPLGSIHPSYPDMRYPLNYGFVKGIFAADGEEQDVYIMGVNEPLSTFEGDVIAVIRRLDDVEDKWVVAPVGASFTKSEIAEAVAFTEQYFKTEIVM